jgi:hypothetical protein
MLFSKGLAGMAAIVLRRPWCYVPLLYDKNVSSGPSLLVDKRVYMRSHKHDPPKSINMRTGAGPLFYFIMASVFRDTNIFTPNIMIKPSVPGAASFKPISCSRRTVGD